HNPGGKGYYIEEANAVDKPLPNIEDPNQRIQNWNDQPEPVGVGLTPQGFGPRLQRSVRFDPKTGQMLEIKPTFFNAAFPALIAPRVAAGDRVRVMGMRADGPIEFVLPPCSLRVQLRFGDQWIEREPAIDQVGIEADSQRVFLSYRYPFRYKMVPLQWRYC